MAPGSLHLHVGGDDLVSRGQLPLPLGNLRVEEGDVLGGHHVLHLRLETHFEPTSIVSVTSFLQGDFDSV